MNGHTHIAMEWKDQSPGPDCSTLPSFLTDPFPAEPLVEDCAGNDGSDGAGFERHRLSVAMDSLQEEGKPMSATPHFGQRSSSSNSLFERMQARAGFSIAKLSMPDSEYSGARSPYLAIPPGLSPASLLESPVFHSNAMASPTTGKLLMLGDTNNNSNTRLEPSSIEDGPGEFSFKSLEIKSSQYSAEGKKGSQPNSQHPSAPSRDVHVKTETNTQMTTRGANPQFNNRLAADSATAGGDNIARPPDHSPPATAADSEAAKGDYPAAVAMAAPAEDGYSWRKYGQKQVKHSEYPQSSCSAINSSFPMAKRVLPRI